MNTLLTLAFLFFCGSLLGWVLELFFRRLFGDKKWVNPGFLRGPWLPIYGLGLDALYLLCRIDLSFLPGYPLQAAFRVLLMGAGMTLIEYIGGLNGGTSRASSARSFPCCGRRSARCTTSFWTGYSSAPWLGCSTTLPSPSSWGYSSGCSSPTSLPR